MVSVFIYQRLEDRKLKIKALQEERSKQIKRCDLEKEFKAQKFIDDKFLSYTNQYLSILETKKSDNNIDNLKRAVKELKNILIDENRHPSERVEAFDKALHQQEKTLKTFNDPTWQWYCKVCFAALVIACTGVIPGLVGLAVYSKASGRSPLFFTKSEGENFTADCYHVLSKHEDNKLACTENSF